MYICCLLARIEAKYFRAILQDSVEERHRHRYEVNPDLVDEFEAAGMKFVGHDSENRRMEIMELDNHQFYVAVQYHPEYISRPMRPSPPYLGLILAATGKLQPFLAKVCQNLGCATCY